MRLAKWPVGWKNQDILDGLIDLPPPFVGEVEHFAFWNYRVMVNFNTRENLNVSNFSPMESWGYFESAPNEFIFFFKSEDDALLFQMTAP